MCGMAGFQRLEFIYFFFFSVWFLIWLAVSLRKHSRWSRGFVRLLSSSEEGNGEKLVSMIWKGKVGKENCYWN